MFDFLSTHQADFLAVLTGLVTIASAAANIFPKATVLGKIVHFFALNFNVQPK